MEESKRELEVRALTGESITVSISSAASVGHLKNLLRKTFRLTDKYPNFNLYHKGIKLNLLSKIDSFSLEPGQVIGLVPVTTKQTSKVQKLCELDNVDNGGSKSSTSFADLAWSSMMQDLREMSGYCAGGSGVSESARPDNGQEFSLKDSAMNSFRMKRKWSLESETTELQNSVKDFFSKENCEKLVQVLNSANCLRHPISQNCVLAGETAECGENAKTCICPLWLKSVVKVFTFFNTYATWLQLRQEYITLPCLEEAFNWLSGVGLQVCLQDIENLSFLCPKVICFVDSSMKEKKFGDAIVIIKSVTKERIQGGPRMAEEQVLVQEILRAIERRETSFRFTLTSLMGQIGSEMPKILSIEDIIIFLGEKYTKPRNISENGSAEVNEVKQPSTRRGCLKKLCHHWLDAIINEASDLLSQELLQDTNALLPHEMIEHLRKGIGSHGQIVYVKELSGRRPIYTEIPSEFSESTKNALAQLGIFKLYSHQAESIKASLEGENVAVATMTSSGKSLCYNLPVLEELFNNSAACALYMFPTKALSQDQLRALRDMTKKFGISSYIGIYDGDTLQSVRTRLRDNARLLITNPDMLHKSILPYHKKFTRILSNLRYVVIDEAHVYKGAFGCHTALVIRRLRRLCAHVYGSDPKFIFSTATSVNPQQFCMELANLSTLKLIKNDGSPAAQKFFVMWNPASRPSAVLGENEVIVNASKSADRGSSPIWEVSRLFAEMVQHGLRCITFCTSRKFCELVLSYSQEILHVTAPRLANSITSYRAGYSPEERRAIESDFSRGKLRGLAATNALELGIDVGHLDATLHLGFPSSIASLWQQAGRSGRRGKPSLAVYVAFEGPLDQYFMKYPEKLFGSPIERCIIDAQNQKVLEQHLRCAANEHPLSLHYDKEFFGEGLCSAAKALENSGELSFNRSADSSARMLKYIGREKRPSDNVNIRAIETEVYHVINTQNNEFLEKIEESKAFFQVHDGAVYMRRGKTYLVTELSVSRKIAWCQEADLDYFTKTRDHTDIRVTGDMAYPVTMPYIPITDADGNMIPRTSAQADKCKVVTTWFGFRCINRFTNEVMNTVELQLPTYTFQSQAVWIQVPKEAARRALILCAGVHAASHALLNAVPLLRMTFNSYDFAPECPHPDKNHNFALRILLYDKHPGGTGISMQVLPYFTKLLTYALELISSCGCSAGNGCPKCIQSPACHEYNEDLHKASAIIIIKCVLDAEKSKFGEALLNELS